MDGVLEMQNAAKFISPQFCKIWIEWRLTNIPMDSFRSNLESCISTMGYTTTKDVY